MAVPGHFVYACPVSCPMHDHVEFDEGKKWSSNASCMEDMNTLGWFQGSIWGVWVRNCWGFLALPAKGAMATRASF